MWLQRSDILKFRIALVSHIWTILFL